jgi:hypothetical protein
VYLSTIALVVWNMYGHMFGQSLSRMVAAFISCSLAGHVVMSEGQRQEKGHR